LQQLVWNRQVFAHEVRNLISTATHAMTAIRTGQVGLTGPTGAVLNRCLAGLGNLVDRSLQDARSGGQLPARAQLINLPISSPMCNCPRDSKHAPANASLRSPVSIRVWRWMAGGRRGAHVSALYTGD